MLQSSLIFIFLGVSLVKIAVYYLYMWIPNHVHLLNSSVFLVISFSFLHCRLFGFVVYVSDHELINITKNMINFF